jgi:hypothetical protein
LPTVRPFAFNSGSTIQGTTQVGSLAVVTGSSFNFSQSNLNWYNGPDEDLGYVVGYSATTQPVPNGGNAQVQFWRSKLLTDSSFIDLAQYISRKYSTPQTFLDANSASSWLTTNGYWSSYVCTATIQINVVNAGADRSLDNLYISDISNPVTYVSGNNFPLFLGQSGIFTTNIMGINNWLVQTPVNQGGSITGCNNNITPVTYTIIGIGEDRFIENVETSCGCYIVYDVTLPCFVKGTVITLADGTTKLVEDIDYNDILRVWNFDEGKIDESPVLWKMRKHVSSIYWKITLEDGTVLKLVGSKNKSHRLFNIQQGKFIYPQDFNDGEQTYKEDGSIIKLLSAEKIEEEVEFYNLETSGNINVFANNTLCGSRFSNIYPIQNMKFVKDDRTLYKRSEFYNIPDKYFYGLRLTEQKNLIEERGLNNIENHIIDIYVLRDKNLVYQD